MTRPAGPPAACAVAFKEWAGICRALAEGRQSLLLRKGGIAEGRQSLLLRKGGIAEGPGGFAPEHPAFWLYPTRLHESQHGLIDEAPPPASAPPGSVALDTLAVVAEVAYCDRPGAIDALRDLHVWTDETVRSRFHYRRPGLWVLAVRAWHRAEPHLLAVTPEQAGCKSWVELPDAPPAGGLRPVLDDAEFGRRLGRIRAALTGP